ncbi:hypothetical protein DAPPUDRAFT_262035 [Daphnia pulex]|uniref:Uncharacterized protein n=1 Tax=Daphnia pulex TaxID=6669 RepID=E9HM68_DAPPU|nr:hypothetical protein DAPPUDRAFT_262035 [Daphnia pulex]|eukprot:EFX67181.1 hypothetical protein DAPPUDRAFT_262035 [Daphnia pulex]
MKVLLVMFSLLLVCATAVPQWWPYVHQQQSLYMSSMFPGYNNFAVAQQSSNYGGYPYAQQQPNHFLAFPAYPSHSAAAAAAVATSGSFY